MASGVDKVDFRLYGMVSDQLGVVEYTLCVQMIEGLVNRATICQTIITRGPDRYMSECRLL
jgi:hypothetical protein